MNRPARFCDVCKQVDDHPRHVQSFTPPMLPLLRHLDCCAESGCEICIASLEEYGHRHGQELIDHLATLRQG